MFICKSSGTFFSNNCESTLSKKSVYTSLFKKMWSDNMITHDARHLEIKGIENEQFVFNKDSPPPSNACCAYSLGLHIITEISTHYYRN